MSAFTRTLSPRVGASLRVAKGDREPMSHGSRLVRLLQQYQGAVTHRFCLQVRGLDMR
jgi:hypothetical protein